MPHLYPDPIHGRIEIPDALHPVVHTRVMARIRNVRQLGLTTVSYPGAVHTRFEHSLGTVAVMRDLMDQFGVRDDSIRDAYLRAALISEIGALPFSANTLTLFGGIGVTKESMYSLMYDRHLRDELCLSTDDELVLLDTDVQRRGWFAAVPGFDQFATVTPVQLASRIDYVLRDGHYTGRYRDGFDYRYFRSLDPAQSAHARSEWIEGIRELHRCIHALNAVYGDGYRRFLTQVLIRLCRRLEASGEMNLRELADPSVFVDLDDDVFMSVVKTAVGRVTHDDALAHALYAAVAYGRQPRVDEWPIDKETVGLDVSALEGVIGEACAIDPETVFVLAEPHSIEVGFRLFGKDYSSYQDAVRSPEFQSLTGLHQASDKVGLQAEGKLQYFVLQ